MEFTIKNLSYQFRVKKLSIIEVLAIRANLGYDTIDEATELFSSILERIEVKFEDKWLPVKLKNLSQLTPVALNEDILAVKQIVDFFISEYLTKVFTKSNESKN